MADLRTLREHVILTLDSEFLAADDPRGILAYDAIVDTQPVRADVDMNKLDALVDEMMSTYSRYDTETDKAMAIRLHRILNVSRRQASDRHMWTWLGTCRYPHFVAWRWKPAVKGSNEGLRASNRFLGDPVRNAFARLWWAAEFTRDEDSYGLTDQLLSLSGFQDGYEAMFGRSFCQYRPALRAFIEEVGPKQGKVLRETAREFGYLLTTLVLEACSYERLAATLRELVREVESRIGDASKRSN